MSKSFIEAAHRMGRSGGSFERHIAAAYFVADSHNRERLTATFRDLFDKFADRDVETAVRAYFECALWASTDDYGQALDRSYNIDDIAAADVEAAADFVRDFITENRADIDAAIAHPTVRYTMESVGHDLWLTRNRHGAGFWDRGLGEIGDRLTKAAHAAGESTLYVNDSNRLNLYN